MSAITIACESESRYCDIQQTDSTPTAMKVYSSLTETPAPLNSFNFQT